MNNPKFKIGDKVVQTVYQENDTVMRTTGTIESINTDAEYIFYWVSLKDRSWYRNGFVIKHAKKSAIPGSIGIRESELELIP